MSIMDYKDKLDAERAIKRARSHGDSDSIMAFRDRMDAQRIVTNYNRTQTSMNSYRERMSDPPQGLIENP